MSVKRADLPSGEEGGGIMMKASASSSHLSLSLLVALLMLCKVVAFYDVYVCRTRRWGIIVSSHVL